MVEHDRRGASVRLERLTQHDERKERPDRRNQPIDVADGLRNHGVGLADPGEHRS